MDINSIALGVPNIQNLLATHRNQDEEIGRFQEILNEAMQANNDRAVVRHAAEMFEAYFLQMMFREMRRSDFAEHGLFPRSNAERIFTDMLDEEMATQAATTRNGMGLADMIYRQMTRLWD